MRNALRPHVIILIDNSGSMQSVAAVMPDCINAIVEPLRAFTNTPLVSYVQFNDGAYPVFIAQPADKAPLVDNFYMQGGTNIWRSMEQVCELHEQKAKGHPLIVIACSDGAIGIIKDFEEYDYYSGKTHGKQAEEVAQSKPYVITVMPPSYDYNKRNPDGSMPMVSAVKDAQVKSWLKFSAAVPNDVISLRYDVTCIKEFAPVMADVVEDVVRQSYEGNITKGQLLRAANRKEFH